MDFGRVLGYPAVSSDRDLELSLILEGGPGSGNGKAYTVGPRSRGMSVEIRNLNPGSHM